MCDQIGIGCGASVVASCENCRFHGCLLANGAAQQADKFGKGEFRGQGGGCGIGSRAESLTCVADSENRSSCVELSAKCLLLIDDRIQGIEIEIESLAPAIELGGDFKLTHKASLGIREESRKIGNRESLKLVGFDHKASSAALARTETELNVGLFHGRFFGWVVGMG